MGPEALLLQEIFASEGPLARLFGARLTGVFEARDGQLRMAEHVLSAYEQESIALIEAGTGVGKSLAYLIPAVIWALKHQEKSVISTHTIALQEQLLKKDIPFLLKAVGADLKAVLVKGMSNYLCLRKIDENPGHPLAFFAETSAQGCRSEIEFPVASQVWDEVKAESLSCGNVHCSRYRQCFFFKARREAEDAQLLIVNHHLLLTDMALKKRVQKGEEASILPVYSRVVIDEAHHFEDVALECLSNRVEGLSLIRMLAPLFSEKHRRSLQEKLSLEKYRSVQHLLEIDLPGERTRLTQLIDEAFYAVKALLPSMNRKRLRGEREVLKPKFIELAEAMRSFAESLFAVAQAIEEKGATVEIVNTAGRLEESASILRSFAEGEESVRYVRLGESSLLGAAIAEVDLNVAEELKTLFFDRMRSAVLCSATLASNQSFDYVRSRLGITDSSGQIYDSPFDYAGRTIFAIPSDLPDPASPFFLKAAIEQISKILEASKGNAFVLFTSYEMLKAAYEVIAPRHKFNFLRQQDASRSVLLERFKARDGSVLFGTDSFWEGVDVPGDALRCVIIVKLPFRVPSDPIEEAQKEALLAQKKDAFREKNIPEAVVKFKQGFGRLMRTKSDRGAVVCLDTRLLTKGYGKYFLGSLPPSRTLFAPAAQVNAELSNFFTGIPK